MKSIIEKDYSVTEGFFGDIFGKIKNFFKNIFGDSKPVKTETTQTLSSVTDMISTNNNKLKLSTKNLLDAVTESAGIMATICDKENIDKNLVNKLNDLMFSSLGNLILSYANIDKGGNQVKIDDDKIVPVNPSHEDEDEEEENPKQELSGKMKSLKATVDDISKHKIDEFDLDEISDSLNDNFKRQFNLSTNHDIKMFILFLQAHNEKLFESSGNINGLIKAFILDWTECTEKDRKEIQKQWEEYKDTVEPSASKLNSRFKSFVAGLNWMISEDRSSFKEFKDTKIDKEKHADFYKTLKKLHCPLLTLDGKEDLSLVYKKAKDYYDKYQALYKEGKEPSFAVSLKESLIYEEDRGRNWWDFKISEPNLGKFFTLPVHNYVDKTFNKSSKFFEALEPVINGLERDWRAMYNIIYGGKIEVSNLDDFDGIFKEQSELNPKQNPAEEVQLELIKRIEDEEDKHDDIKDTLLKLTDGDTDKEEELLAILTGPEDEQEDALKKLTAGNDNIEDVEYEEITGDKETKQELIDAIKDDINSDDAEKKIKEIIKKIKDLFNGKFYRNLKFTHDYISSLSEYLKKHGDDKNEVLEKDLKLTTNKDIKFFIKYLCRYENDKLQKREPKLIKSINVFESAVSLDYEEIIQELFKYISLYKKQSEDKYNKFVSKFIDYKRKYPTAYKQRIISISNYVKKYNRELLSDHKKTIFNKCNKNNSIKNLLYDLKITEQSELLMFIDFIKKTQSDKLFESRSDLKSDPDKFWYDRIVGIARSYKKTSKENQLKLKKAWFNYRQDAKKLDDIAKLRDDLAKDLDYNESKDEFAWEALTAIMEEDKEFYKQFKQDVFDIFEIKIDKYGHEDKRLQQFLVNLKNIRAKHLVPINEDRENYAENFKKFWEVFKDYSIKLKKISDSKFGRIKRRLQKHLIEDKDDHKLSEVIELTLDKQYDSTTFNDKLSNEISDMFDSYGIDPEDLGLEKFDSSALHMLSYFIKKKADNLNITESIDIETGKKINFKVVLEYFARWFKKADKKDINKFVDSFKEYVKQEQESENDD